MYSLSSCYLKRINGGLDSPLVSGGAGCITGAAISVNSGPAAALKSCAGMGIFSYIFDGKSSSISESVAGAATLVAEDVLSSHPTLLNLPLPLVRRISEGRERRRREVAAEREFKEILKTPAGRRVFIYHKDVKLNSRPRGGDWERRQRYRRQANARRTRLTLASQDRYHDIIEKHLEKVRRGQRKGRAG